MTTSLDPRAWRVGVVAIAVVLASCTSDAVESPTPQASASASAVPASETATAAPSATNTPGDEGTSLFDLEVGDCFGDADEVLDAVIVVDCAETHVYEAFAVLDHEAGPTDPYPGNEATLEHADEACRGPFEDFVGHDYETSVYWITTVTPSAATWAEGDREIICTLRLGEDGEPITGSAEGSGE